MDPPNDPPSFSNYAVLRTVLALFVGSFRGGAQPRPLLAGRFWNRRRLRNRASALLHLNDKRILRPRPLNWVAAKEFKLRYHKMGHSKS